jgi:hypothetical protein
MRTTSLVLAFIVWVCAAAAAQEFAEYVSRQDGFKIDFPGTPTVSDTTFKSQQNYMLPGRVYTVDKGAEHYSVTVIDYGGIEKMAIARVANCPSGARALCKGTDVSGPGVWKHDVREAVLWATLQFLQRDNMKVSDLTWSQHDLVEGNELQLTNTASGARTYAYIALHEMKLFIVEATVPKGAPPATLFQTSMGWVDKNGKGIRYQNMYIGASHSMREFAVPATGGGPPATAAAAR